MASTLVAMLTACNALFGVDGLTYDGAGGVAPGPTTTVPGEIVTDSDLDARLRRGEPLRFPEGTRFTMLAEERLRALGMETARAESSAPARGGLREVIAIGGDHRGFPIKEKLRGHLEERGFAVMDCGAHDDQPSDYPVLARCVAEAVANGSAWAGVFVDGSGMGSAVAANKVSGVRATHCRSADEARSAREHNHAQVLTLHADTDGLTTVVDTFLRTPFGAGRHARRVDMMEES